MWYMSENPYAPRGVHTYAGEVNLIDDVQWWDDTLPERVKEAI
jgi:hypothetical protein